MVIPRVRAAHFVRAVAALFLVSFGVTILAGPPQVRAPGLPPPQGPQGGPVPNRPSPQPLTYEGLIVGRVIDATTGRPVPGAAVTLNGGVQPQMQAPAPGAPRPMPPQPPRFLTDAEGRFAFRNLTRGNYTISAEKSGYATGLIGQSRPEGPARSLSLADRDRRGDVTIRLFKHATISGTIVDDAGEPVVGARVRVLRRTLVAGRRVLQQGQMTQTDDRGEYRVASLLPGEYVISVPQSSSSLPSDFALSGPMPANLSTTLSTPGSTGFSLSPGTGPATADGRFRLSSSGSSPFITAPGAGGRVMAYATQYYPGASVVSQAQPVVVASGEDRAGVDLVLRMRSTSSVAGILTGPDGPAANFALHLVPSDNGEMSVDPSIATAVTDTNGAFAFLAVPSGQYVIQTVRAPRPAPPPPPPPPMPLQGSSQTFTTMGPGGTPITGTMTMGVSGGVTGGVAGSSLSTIYELRAQPTEPTLWVAAPISVGEGDIGGLALTLREGLSLSGQIEFDGAAERPPAPRMTQLSVVVQPADGKQRNSSQPGRFDASGRFTLPQVLPGLYRLSVNGSFPNWTLRSAVVNGVDVLDVPFALDKNLAGIVVTFTDRTSTLTGTVRMPVAVNDPGAAQKNPDVAVIVFPAEPQIIAAGFNPRRTRMQRVSPTSGTFGFGTFPPGEYYAIAIPDEFSAEWQDPKYLEYLTRSASRITIAEGERKTIDLAIEDARPPGREPAPAPHDEEQEANRDRGPFVDDAEQSARPAPPAPPAPAAQARDARMEERGGSGIISGVVLLDDTTPRPVRHARVTLTGGVGVNRTVLTDEQGRFMVATLPAGRYSVYASKASYLTAYYGGTRPGRGPSAPLLLATGQSITDVTLRMAKGGVITGRITDEFGMPLQGLNVRVLQPLMREGERVWSQVGISGGGPNTSDDRGIYRIYGVPPGNYLVTATPMQTGGTMETRQLSEDEMRAAIAALTAPVPTPASTPGADSQSATRVVAGRGAGLPGRTAPAPSAPPTQSSSPLVQQAPVSFPQAGRAVGHSPVYYPGTALEHEATLVSVAVGQELTGIDLPMRLIPTARIEGVVVTPDGRPADRVSVQVASTIGSMTNSSAVRYSQDGKFVSASLPPGKYVLSARTNPPPPPPPASAPGSAPAPPRPVTMPPGLFAMQEIVINGEDISGVTLTLGEGSTVSGRVVFQGTLAKPEASRVRILAEPVGANRVALGTRSIVVDESGTFEVTGLTPGRYRLSAAVMLTQPMANAGGVQTGPMPAQPPGWVLKSSTVDGRDTLDVPLDVRPGQNIRGAVVTFTDKPAELSGAILDAARNGVPDLTVVLFATERALWTMNPRRLRSLRSSSDGSFRFAAMPPGEYFLAVISELDQASWGDPSFMDQVAAAAIRMTIAEGEKKVQDIQIK